eukprot:g13800.t1
MAEAEIFGDDSVVVELYGVVQRRLGPDAAREAIPELLQSPSESPIWERDDLLMPVLEDDVLLFEAAEDSDEETAETLPSATGKGKGGV